MAEKTIPELNPISTLEENYVFPLDSGIQTYKVFWSTIKAFIWNHVISTFTALTTPAGTDLIGVELGTGANAGKIRKVTLADLKTFISENAGVPIGGVIGFFDFGGLCTYNPNVFALVNGQTINDVASPLHLVTLPNATGRALLGYGTEGGSDMASASWGVSPVGNTNHQLQLAHTHDYVVALREINTTPGRFWFQARTTQDLSYSAAGAGVIMSGATFGGSSVANFVSPYSYRAFVNRTFTNTDSIYDIRMRSIRVRWLLRYK